MQLMETGVLGAGGAEGVGPLAPTLCYRGAPLLASLVTFSRHA